MAIHVDYANNGDRRYSYFVEHAGALVNADEIKAAKKLECKTIKASRTDF
ncbi:hypothetical protein [Streptomyces collinus]